MRIDWLGYFKIGVIMRFGYFTDALTKLMKELKGKHLISEAQKRLILKELSSIKNFEELDFETQKMLYISIVGKYVNIRKELIRNSLK